LVDVAMAKEVKNLAGHTGPVSAVAFSSKGDLLYSASADKTVRSWSLPGGENKGKLEHDGAVHCLALSKDGKSLASGGADKVVKVWNTAGGKPVAEVTSPD